MDNTYKTPVEIAVSEFGGVRALARAINRDPAAVSRWKKSGKIPTTVQKALLETAWDRGLKMTAHDMVFGR
jgi:hypothetical protein|tara:strand:+ start:402 stop:614 length:213 start_codon:yes stop_codon:yes gene_type:complete